VTNKKISTRDKQKNIKVFVNPKNYAMVRFIGSMIVLQNHVMERSNSGQLVRHHPVSLDAVTSPTSATSASLSDILTTKRSSWPRVILHPSTSVDVAAAGWPRGGSRYGRAGRPGRRARSSSPYVGRVADDSGAATTRADLDDATPTSPVDGATVVRCLDSCDKILLRHSTTIT